MKNTIEMIQAYKDSIVGTLNINQNIETKITTETNNTNINPITITATNNTNNQSCQIKLIPMIWPNTKLCDKLFVRIEVIPKMNDINDVFALLGINANIDKQFIFNVLSMCWEEDYDEKGNRLSIKIEPVISFIKACIIENKLIY